MSGSNPNKQNAHVMGLSGTPLHFDVLAPFGASATGFAIVIVEAGVLRLLANLLNELNRCSCRGA